MGILEDMKVLTILSRVLTTLGYHNGSKLHETKRARDFTMSRLSLVSKIDVSRKRQKKKSIFQK